MLGTALLNLYQNLISEYGDPSIYWPQWCAKNKNTVEREKIIIGMMLVQRTSWHNANIALKRLKNANLLATDKIARSKSLEELTEIIRPAGFFRTKPQRLFDICTFVESSGGVNALLSRDSESVRKELLSIKGVGKETADTILLYALGKPCFVIDEYTYRWAYKNGLPNNRKYDELQEYFQTHLKPNVEIYQNLHALIIISQRGREKSKMDFV